MRVVLDTNIFISGFRSGGKPKLAFERAMDGTYTLVVTEDLLLEIEDVLSRKFGWPRATVESTLERVVSRAEVVSPEFVLDECADADDNRILEAAVEGRANYIVSGDKHLLRMKRFRGVEVLTVNDFLLRIGS